MDNEKGFCEYCKIFYGCPWFCSKEIDEKNNLKDQPCFSRELIEEGEV